MCSYTAFVRAKLVRLLCRLSIRQGRRKKIQENIFNMRGLFLCTSKIIYSGIPIY